MIEKTFDNRPLSLLRFLRYVAFSVLPFLTTACTPSVQSLFLNYDILEQRPSAYENPLKTNSTLCDNALNYAPDTAHLEHTPMKYIRVNVHFMNSSDSTQNFNGAEGIRYAKDLIRYSNIPLKENKKMFLPKGNDTPVLPLRYEYVLTPATDDPNDEGVYFHYDDELFYFVQVGENRNLASRAVLNTYNVGGDTIMNLFIMPHHPDSIASPTYSVTHTGIALGNNVKVAGLYESDKPVWFFKGLINHEIGHVLGLSHTWSYPDGCDDTPTHQNCWNKTEAGPCKDGASNNVMDYNSRQNAWTPCQIGRIHRTFANTYSRSRKILVDNWCRLNPDKHIIITDSIHWTGAKDLEGDLTVAAGGYLRVSCRLSIPKGGKITVKTGGTLVLDQSLIHNACGDNWQGIVIEKEKKTAGKVIAMGDIRLENMDNPLVSSIVDTKE
jgi:hypothetical protein